MNKELIFKIDDSDFGEVSVFYYPEASAIIADSLYIKNVPADYDIRQIFKMWCVFKAHYDTYGMVVCFYSQIDEMDEMMSK